MCASLMRRPTKAERGFCWGRPMCRCGRSLRGKFPCRKSRKACRIMRKRARRARAAGSSKTGSFPYCLPAAAAMRRTRFWEYYRKRRKTKVLKTLFFTRLWANFILMGKRLRILPESIRM